MRRPVWVGVAAASLLGCPGAQAAPVQATGDAEQMRFETEVRPLLAARCSECHGAEVQEAGLRLDEGASVFDPAREAPLVVAGDPDASRLIQLVRGGADLQMPPDDRLPRAEVAILEQWVARGAVWPDYRQQEGAAAAGDGPSSSGFTEAQRAFWAFQDVRDEEPPLVADEAWVRTDVDRFILARLEAAGLRPAPAATRPELLRRVTYDLTGLPPSYAELQAFLADDDPGAYARVVERLLASPRYGEHWGRHWLDVARFAESAGHDGNNAYLHAWRYRDYVIRALNDDKPFDQFIVEQLAGDLLPKTGDRQRDYDQIVATGFLQVGSKPVVMRDKRQMLLDIADEQLTATGAAFLALTIGCARCHDHKFDPIPTRDYYALAGIFTSTRVMADAAPDSKWHEARVVDPAGGEAPCMAVEDLPAPANLPIHVRGNYRTLGAEAPRGFLEIVGGARCVPSDAAGSGRLELARWIADPANPLTARVAVNRIWQHHFGRGLTASSGNFGSMGARPTHPELLDWLAQRFVDSGWSSKAMHRLIVLSAAYQQAAAGDRAGAARDPENNLLWHARPRRLAAEEVRDSLLAASGQLDFTMGGTLFDEGYGPVDASRGLFAVDISGKDPFPPFEAPRRSVYLPVLRNARPEILRLFDAANEHESTSVRGETSVPAQALYLMNSRFVRRQAEWLALEAVMASRPAGAGSDATAGVSSVYRAALGREPTDAEQDSARGFLQAYGGALGRVAERDERDRVERGDAERDADVALAKAPDLLLDDRQSAGGPDRAPPRRLTLALAEQTLGALTVEIWFRPAAIESGTLVACDGGPLGVWRVGIEPSGDGTGALLSEFYAPRAGGRRVAEGAARIEPGRWSHAMVTYAGGKRRAYVNGTLVDESATEAELALVRPQLTVGATHDGSHAFAGQVARVSLYRTPCDDARARRRYLTFLREHLPAGVADEFAGWRALAQTLLCSNEFLYVE